MTKEEFYRLWTLTYPETAQVSYLFRHELSDRWFRIHSLPESKRYAEDNNDWKILLTRQNEIITDLFGLDTNILLVTGEYNWGDEKQIHLIDEDEIFKTYLFTRLDNINLHNLYSKYYDYDKEQVYRPAFAETIWRQNQQDKLLREIAIGNIRAFFVSFDKNIIVAPYDGGVDIILKDSLTRDYYKNKYNQWLSEREDGM